MPYHVHHVHHVHKVPIYIKSKPIIIKEHKPIIIKEHTDWAPASSGWSSGWTPSSSGWASSGSSGWEWDKCKCRDHNEIH